jgi:glucokinase
MLIAGDIGGTKTDLAIYSIESGPRTPLAQTEVRSADYSSLQAVVAEFLEDVDLSVDAGSFAVAGPVIAGHVKTTNLPWVMDERALAGDLNLSAVHLMNDLEGVARSASLTQRRSRDPQRRSSGRDWLHRRAGAGNRLGEAFFTGNGSQYLAYSSEGGHSDFAPTDERQIALLRYLTRRLDHVAVERVCSGIGVPHADVQPKGPLQAPEGARTGSCHHDTRGLDRRRGLRARKPGRASGPDIDMTWSL